MPSGITHILLAKNLQDLVSSDNPLKFILEDSAAFLTIGSVAPDLPYASVADIDTFLTRQKGLADQFHYEQTNQIPLRSFITLKSIKENTEEELFYQMFCFFLGYTSHVVADGIFHPFIRDWVGDYSSHKAEHRSLELQLDVLYFRELTKNSGCPLDLIYTDIQKELLNYKSCPQWQSTFHLFSQLIKDVYSVDDTTADIHDWIDGLDHMFTLAGGTYLEIIRKLKKNSVQFRSVKDIDAVKISNLSKPFDRDANFLHTDKINYFEQCVPMFFTEFLPIVQHAYQFVFEDGLPLTEKEIPAINLDTGRLIINDNLDLIPEFWK